jgi:hypothetical protein
MTKTEILQMAQRIVVHWEAIPDRVARLAKEIGRDTPEMRATLTQSMQEMIGGIEVYEAAKRAVDEHGKLDLPGG